MLRGSSLLSSEWFPTRLRGPRRRGAPQRNGTFSALRVRNYRLFFTGQLISVTGTFMQSTAQQWLVLTLSRDPLALGITGALQFGPLLLLAPFGGAIADRWPRRNVLLGTQISAGILAAALWLLTVFGVVQLWHVFILAGLLGLVNAVDMPTRQAFVSEMVPPEILLNAVSLNSVQFNVARILGPGLAGALIALLGVPILFLLNALSFVAVIIGLALMRPHELMPMPRQAVTKGLAGLRALGDGARFVLADPKLRVLFLLVAVVGTMGFNWNVLLPLEARLQLNAGPETFGLLSSALGVGALCGALLLARRSVPPTNTLILVSAGAFGVLEAGIALTRSVPLAMLGIALTGAAMSTFSASANTRTQLATPPALRGRVMSVYMMIFAGTTPIGNLIASGVAGAAGVELAFAVSGLPCALVAVVAFVLWRRGSGTAARTSAPSMTESMPPATPLPTPPLATAAQAPNLVPFSPSASGSSLPARMPQRGPGHPKPQPRAADPH